MKKPGFGHARHLEKGSRDGSVIARPIVQSGVRARVLVPDGEAELAELRAQLASKDAVIQSLEHRLQELASKDAVIESLKRQLDVAFEEITRLYDENLAAVDADVDWADEPGSPRTVPCAPPPVPTTSVKSGEPPSTPCAPPPLPAAALNSNRPLGPPSIPCAVDVREAPVVDAPRTPPSPEASLLQRIRVSSMPPRPRSHGALRIDPESHPGLVELRERNPSESDPPPSSGTDRRSESRVACVFEVEFVRDTHFFAGLTLDISSGGLFVATYNLLPVGTELELSFELPGLGEVAAEGCVRWTRSADSAAGRPGLGIAFTSISEESLRRVVSYCERNPPRYVEL